MTCGFDVGCQLIVHLRHTFVRILLIDTPTCMLLAYLPHTSDFQNSRQGQP